MSARRSSALLFSPAPLWHRRSILALFCVFKLATQKGVCDPGVYPRLYGFSIVRVSAISRRRAFTPLHSVADTTARPQHPQLFPVC